MKNNKLFLSILLFLVTFSLSAQKKQQIIQNQEVVHPTVIKEAIHFSISKPLRDLPPSKGPRTKEEQAIFKKLKKERERHLNIDMEHRAYPYESKAFPIGDDPIWQRKAGKTLSQTNKSALLNIQGQDSPYSVSDCNGAAGANHFMQGVNMTYAIWDKSGTQVVAPTNFNTLFEGVDGANRNDGDPIVLYDDQADRWLVAEFSLGSNNYMLIAVSETNDPTGSWYRWSFDVADMPDYEKFGIWRDGYYMATNNGSAEDVYVFEREEMLIGSANPKMVGFQNPHRPASGFHCIEPLDNDGPYAPVGTPGQFITINDDAWGGSEDALWIFELDVDWTNTSNSTFQRTQIIPTEAFDSNFGSSWDNIAQKGTSRKVDAVPQILMYRAQYRNFDKYQTIVCAHAVDVDASDHAGIRWYELENSGNGWNIRQQGTYAPDDCSRWIPSITMAQNHNIALGYNISSSDMFPGIRYCGQSALENQNSSGTMNLLEETIVDGTESHTSDNRWADYAEMSIDPSDDETFWFTTEYAKGTDKKTTKIVKFKFDDITLKTIDVGADILLSPHSAMDLTDAETIIVSVKNYGNNTVSNIPIYCQVDGGAVLSGTISTSLASGEVTRFTFSETVDLSEIKSYQFKLYTALDNDENLINDTLYRTITHLPPVYCNAEGGGSSEYISNVECGSLSNSSSRTSYTDFTQYSTNIGRGTSIDITVTSESGYSTDQCLIWIDYNQDYSFDDNEKVYESEINEGPYSGSITVPDDALLGNTVMRIRLHDTSNGWGATPNATPCGSSSYGEVEDYTVNIVTADNIQNQLKETYLKVTPNPASNIIVITSSKQLNANLQIIDITGKIIYSDAIEGNIYRKEIDLTKEANGIYFVKIIQDEAVIETQRFVLKH